jgi:hypothetical protein
MEELPVILPEALFTFGHVYSREADRRMALNAEACVANQERNGSRGKVSVTIETGPLHDDYGATPSTRNVRPLVAACRIGLIAA